MNLPSFSVRRPVFTSMIMLIIIVVGVASFMRLRIDMLPSIEIPTLSVRINYEGASPEVMEQQVTQIIEEIVATVPGIEELTSSSQEGSANVRVTFAWGTDIDAAAVDLRATIENEINELPDDIDPPRVSKFDIDSFPVVILGISSDLDPIEMTTVVEEDIRYRFARIPGVAQVDLWGGFNRELRVELSPEKIKALGLSLNDVIRALRDSNLDLPTGSIEQGRYEVTLRAPGQFESVEQIGETVVAIRDRAPVRIRDIGSVRDTYQKLSWMARVNGMPGLRVGIRKQADANTVEVSRAILKEIEEVNRDFPQVTVVPVTNQGNFIERSISNVAQSVVYGGGLAIAILLFFLRNVRSTVVISLSIPISIIATFSLMYLGGFTLNLMTLGGLALGVGMMVDSSIVVLENIFRLRDEEALMPQEAAARGAQEVASAIIASTITTLVIFLPLIFVRGVSGLLFQEFGYVVAFSLICSLFVSLSLVPMLASRLLKPKGQLRSERMQRVKDWSDRAFRGLDNGYRNLLLKALRRPLTIIISTLVLLGLSLMLWPLLGTELLPPSDEGEVRVSGEMEVGTRLDLVNERSRKIEAIVNREVPDMVSSVVSVREGSMEMTINLRPVKERTKSNVEIANDLRKALEGSIGGVEIRTRAPQGQFILNRLLGGGNESLTIEIRGYDLDILTGLAAETMDAIRNIPGITDVDSDMEEGTPQQEIRLDRDKIADLGLRVRDVAEIIRTAIAGSRAGDYFTEGNAYRILVQMENAHQMSIADVLDLTVGAPDGSQVALRNLVSTQESRAPMEIRRKDQQRLARVWANIEGRDMGSVAADVLAAINQIPRPTGYDISIGGNFEEQQESFMELMFSVLLAMLLVYMVLACQYESLRDPLIVMLSVPMAAIGVLVTLFLTGTTMNLQSGLGCIMLVGIVVNNAILLVDQAGRLKDEGMAVKDAIAEAGRRRLRPILMTTCTTILGLVPLALGIGEGADAQAPMARAVVGGLLGSTIITLVLIPSVYSVVHRDKKVKVFDER